MPVKHGHKTRERTSPEYRTWIGIKRRCYDPKCKDFAQYGAKGIRLSAEWDSSFLAFFRDMGEKPSPTHQIDRKDPKGDYSAANCRWVTPFEQGSENRSTLIPIEVDGIKFHSIKAAARHFGVNVTAVHYRIKSGVPIEDAFSAHRMKPRRPRESYLAKSHPDRELGRPSENPQSEDGSR
jgi:hypothetical protein